MSATAPTRPRPDGLTVLYDARCQVCRRARRWVERQRQLLPVRFVPAGSDRARRRFPELEVGSTLADVTVVTDDGAVLRGEQAWIAVLWAVARTRPRAVALAYGRRRWMLRRAKGAADAIRRLSASQPDPALTRSTAAADRRRSERDPAAWPAPTTPPCGGTCVGGTT